MHVPVWHAKTQDDRNAGRVRLLGIVQEQHSDRARLFKQWKRLDWPILVDSYNRLEVPYVPIMLGVDESGTVRHIWPAGMGVAGVQEFVAADAAPVTASSVGTDTDAPCPPDADALARAQEPAGLNDTIAAYTTAGAQAPNDGWAQFRLGVAYRMRHDSAARRDGDFARAVRHWTQALDIDPNNYIWRRRLQQYGPRLAKPYPFYDWVRQAREEIQARGELPLELAVEPSGSEFAKPMSSLGDAAPVGQNPDPDGRIHHDAAAMIQVETTAVPARINPGNPVRVYVTLRPAAGSKVHWNNEVDDLLLWIEPSDGWKVERQAWKHPNPAEALSREARTLEIELRAPHELDAGRVTIPAYALYYVCEDVQGACLYRRQDIALDLEVQAVTQLGGR